MDEEPTSPADSTLRGVAVVGARDWIDDQLGEGATHRLASESDASWPIRILPGEEYPTQPLVDALVTAIEKSGGSRADLEAVIASIAAEAARRNLGSIHKAFLWVASPKLFLRATPRMWAKYASIGTLTNISNEDGRYFVTIANVPPDQVSWVCGAWMGFLPVAVELAGGKNVLAKVLNRSETAGTKFWHVDYEISYE